MEKKLYLVVVKIDGQNPAYLGTTQTSEQAFDIVRNFLNQNQSIKSEQVFVEEYFYKKDLKILDYLN